MALKSSQRTKEKKESLQHAQLWLDKTTENENGKWSKLFAALSFVNGTNYLNFEVHHNFWLKCSTNNVDGLILWIMNEWESANEDLSLTKELRWEGGKERPK